MINYKENDGFTLVEVLLALAIFGLVLSALFNINVAGFRFLNFNQDRVDIMNDARLITTNLEREIRRSSGVQLLDIAGNSSDDLILTNGDIDGDGNIDHTVFYVDSNILKTGNIDGDVSTNSPVGLRNITGPYIINDGYFNLTGSGDLVSFYFELEKDNSTYGISNNFYPRVQN